MFEKLPGHRNDPHPYGGYAVIRLSEEEYGIQSAAYDIGRLMLHDLVEQVLPEHGRTVLRGMEAADRCVRSSADVMHMFPCLDAHRVLDLWPSWHRACDAVYGWLVEHRPDLAPNPGQRRVTSGGYDGHGAFFPASTI